MSTATFPLRAAVAANLKIAGSGRILTVSRVAAMTNSVLPRVFLMSALATSGLFALLAPASAQVRYADPTPFFGPYDEAAGTSPSFEVFPRAYGQVPAVRVVERCQYPTGWDVTDFSRDVNGIPAGLDHTCPVPVGGRLRSRY